jgi:cytochrome c-type biogenesis protein CcmF
VVAFSMSMIGTFLVRSGILTSVHAFAVDPKRGTFILSLLGIYIGGALLLFALRVRHVKEGSTFEIVSREAALVINNLLLSVILGLVFYGTLYPLVTQALGTEISVGPPYFNSRIGPFALVLVVIMAIGPMLRWRRDSLRSLAGRVAIPVLASVATLIALVVLAPDIRLLPMLGLVLAPGVFAASIAPLWGRKLRRTPLFLYGMVVAHAGIAVSLAGMAAESAFTQETLVAVRPGQTARVGAFSVRFNGVAPVVGPNWTAVEADLEVRRGDGAPFTMRPEQRLFTTPAQATSEAAIRTLWDGQLYVAVGDATNQLDQSGRRQLRLWWKPLVTLIWFGGGMIAFGGLLALIGRLRRRRGTKADELSGGEEALA